MEEYQYQTELSSGAFTGILIFWLVLALIGIAAQWKVFEKA